MASSSSPAPNCAFGVSTFSEAGLFGADPSAVLGTPIPTSTARAYTPSVGAATSMPRSGGTSSTPTTSTPLSGMHDVQTSRLLSAAMGTPVAGSFGVLPPRAAGPAGDGTSLTLPFGMPLMQPGGMGFAPQSRMLSNGVVSASLPRPPQPPVTVTGRGSVRSAGVADGAGGADGAAGGAHGAESAQVRQRMSRNKEPSSELLTTVASTAVSLNWGNRYNIVEAKKELARMNSSGASGASRVARTRTGQAEPGMSALALDASVYKSLCEDEEWSERAISEFGKVPSQMVVLNWLKAALDKRRAVKYDEHNNERTVRCAPRPRARARARSE